MSDDLFAGKPNTAAAILYELGQVKGKLDGVLSALNGITADNIRCEADRAELREDMNKKISGVRRNQYWLAGVIAGASFFLAKIFGGSFSLPH